MYFIYLNLGHVGVVVRRGKQLLFFFWVVSSCYATQLEFGDHLLISQSETCRGFNTPDSTLCTRATQDLLCIGGLSLQLETCIPNLP